MRPQEADIKAGKAELRKRYKAVRDGMDAEVRACKDKKILSHILSMPQYKACKTLLVYVSVNSEADTLELISTALSDGKQVAVPRCASGAGRMDFYIIASLGKLEKGAFGLLEPIPGKNGKLTDFSGGLCILPGLVFDMSGYRLGYGGGYYDRFLSGRYSGATAGICYSECVVRTIRRGEHDVPCDFLVTENGCTAVGKQRNKSLL
ncbi:5-formyltetrahydrofolate cyclo-ligase [Clostridia bacterium]|nr:5-formyltetrahydrofolate cyclo-ligase [Clostridia bacterium]